MLAVSALVVALGAFSAWAEPWARGGVYLEDFRSYVASGAAALNGEPLYEEGVSKLPMLGGTFKYTPFAAELFTGLSLVPEPLLPVVALLVNLFALLTVVWLVLGRLGYARDHGRLAATAALGVVGLLSQPVLLNATVGQVNMLLVLLVLGDVAGKGRRWSGIGIGLAAGIKLVPGIFVVYLLITRQFRAAAIAVGTFLATIAVGFAGLPRDSLRFWSPSLADQSRITGDSAAVAENQSLRGTLGRLLDVSEVPAAVWIPVTAVIAAAALWTAWRAHRDGRDLLAVSVVGITMVLVSPWTWTHYWVWFAPFTVMIIGAALRFRSWPPTAAATTYVLLLFPWHIGTGRGGVPLVGLVILPDHFPSWAQAPSHNLYVGIALVLLAIAALRPEWLQPGWFRPETPAPATEREHALTC
ncbi:hypothetical protein Aglo03_66810 [Actinokineospora globicatena]|uniref:Alpha-1,2-mannosyltransferase n=1 Tax=Actinokineospora globicatena TaxID=103729 RepID=A0A9W6QTB4_9PSEU|nr:hypothetical protein Aglo03_66810 [Actinokineospora globicatena]